MYNGVRYWYDGHVVQYLKSHHRNNKMDLSSIILGLRFQAQYCTAYSVEWVQYCLLYRCHGTRRIHATYMMFENLH